MTAGKSPQRRGLREVYDSFCSTHCSCPRPTLLQFSDPAANLFPRRPQIARNPEVSFTDYGIVATSFLRVRMAIWTLWLLNDYLKPGDDSWLKDISSTEI